MQADKSNEQTDAAGNAIFKRKRYAVKNCFTHFCKRQNKKQNAFNKYGRQCNLPRIPHLPYDGIGKKCVQAHAGRQRKRIIGKKRHKQRADAGGNGSCRKYGTGIHTGCG